MQMLVHYLSHRTPEWRFACEHLPQRYTQRIEIRADVHIDPRQLLRTSILGCTSELTGNGNGSLRTRFVNCLGKPEVDDLCVHSVSLLKAHHDVGWFDVPVNEFLLVHGSQSDGHLIHNLERQLHLQAATTLNEVPERLALDEFHRIEVVSAAFAQMENRGNVRMAEASRRARLAHKPKSSRFVAEIFFTNNLQSHRTLQFDIKRFVGDAHSATTQLDWLPVFRRQQLVMLKARFRAARGSLKPVLRRRRAGVGLLTAKHIAKKADWTEAQSARYRLSAARAGTLGLRAHGPNPASQATKALQSA